MSVLCCSPRLLSFEDVVPVEPQAQTLRLTNPLTSAVSFEVRVSAPQRYMLSVGGEGATLTLSPGQTLDIVVTCRLPSLPRLKDGTCKSAMPRPFS